MLHSAIVTFTAKPLQWILRDGGSGDWRLDAERARRMEFLVCTQNRHNVAFGAPDAPHGAAFLVGRILDVVPSPARSDRWLIKIGEYTECNIPNIWRKSGHLRYPVWYTTLEELGLDLGTLPPFRAMPPAGRSAGLAEMATPPLSPQANWSPPNVSQRSASDQEVRRRIDAILAQIDRVPELPAPFDPLDWDDHGLPR